MSKLVRIHRELIEEYFKHEDLIDVDLKCVLQEKVDWFWAFFEIPPGKKLFHLGENEYVEISLPNSIWAVCILKNRFGIQISSRYLFYLGKDKAFRIFPFPNVEGGRVCLGTGNTINYDVLSNGKDVLLQLLDNIQIYFSGKPNNDYHTISPEMKSWLEDLDIDVTAGLIPHAFKLGNCGNYYSCCGSSESCWFNKNKDRIINRVELLRSLSQLEDIDWDSAPEFETVGFAFTTSDVKRCRLVEILSGKRQLTKEEMLKECEAQVLRFMET